MLNMFLFIPKDIIIIIIFIHSFIHELHPSTHSFLPPFPPSFIQSSFIQHGGGATIWFFWGPGVAGEGEPGSLGRSNLGSKKLKLDNIWMSNFILKYLQQMFDKCSSSSLFKVKKQDHNQIGSVWIVSVISNRHNQMVKNQLNSSLPQLSDI